MLLTSSAEPGVLGLIIITAALIVKKIKSITNLHHGCSTFLMQDLCFGARKPVKVITNINHTDGFVKLAAIIFVGLTGIGLLLWAIVEVQAVKPASQA